MLDPAPMSHIRYLIWEIRRFLVLLLLLLLCAVVLLVSLKYISVSLILLLLYFYLRGIDCPPCFDLLGQYLASLSCEKFTCTVCCLISSFYSDATHMWPQCWILLLRHTPATSFGRSGGFLFCSSSSSSVLLSCWSVSGVFVHVWSFCVCFFTWVG